MLWSVVTFLAVAVVSVTYLVIPGVYFLLAKSTVLNSSPAKPIFCYFVFDSTWPNNGTLHPALNTTLCTHILFLGSTIKDSKVSLKRADIVDKYLSKVKLLRRINPGVKLIISNGGLFGEVLSSDDNRTKFIHSAVDFIKQYDLDGFDFDWEFPGWNGNPRGQRPNFTLLLQEMRNSLDQELITTGRKYTLSAAVAAGRAVMVIYDVPGLAKSLDYLNVMGYDYHGYSKTDFITDYNSPLYPNDWWDKIVLLGGNIGWTANEYMKRGMPRSKIMIGVPTYAKVWTLLDPKRYHGLYAPAVGPGKKKVEISYADMYELLKTGAHSVFDTDAAVPYAWKGDQWYSYDNQESLTIKAQWTLDNDFAGIMIYSLNDDDYLNMCGLGKLPLITAISNVFRNKNFDIKRRWRYYL